MARSTGEQWLSVSEAGRALGLSRTSMLAAEDAGLLASVRTPGGHRRYRPAELRRYLRAAGGGWVDAGRPDPVPDPEERRIVALDLATALRAAVRPVARALGAECAGVYLLQDGALRFCAASGVPRWLAERLTGAQAPEPVRHAVDAQRPQLFDPAAAAFPEPRSTGAGVAVALRQGGQPVGVLFVVRGGEDPLSPGDLRSVDAFAELLASTVADRLRIGELERRLAAIAWLAGPAPADLVPTGSL